MSISKTESCVANSPVDNLSYSWVIDQSNSGDVEVAPTGDEAMTIIVVSFNTRSLTLECLKSIEQFEPRAKVVVVDNDSRDGSADSIAQAFPGVKLIRMEQNIGFGRANTIGLQGVDSDYIVLLNSDARLIDGSLSYCISKMRGDLALAAVTPKLMGADGMEQSNRHAVPTFYSTFRRAVTGVQLRPDPRDYWIPGTCLILKREAIDNAGGLFRRELFMYWEDADLCARLKKSGYRLAALDEAMVIHHGGASGGGPNCNAKPGLHEWYTFGRHRWFQTHRPYWEAAALWGLEFVDAFRCLLRGMIRRGRASEKQYGLTLLKTLLRLLFGLAPKFAVREQHGRRDNELISFNHPAGAFPAVVSEVGVVVIGRNEGERLRKCLESLNYFGQPVVYVDSGSTDGSQRTAQELGARLLDLDTSIPFTAGRARNAGWRYIQQEYPQCKYVQFIDGDCIIHPDWLRTARDAFSTDRHIAIICGTLREAHPERSLYNRLCQIEWRRPLGETKACGGIFMGRLSTLRDAGGFDESLIAGEEPELCLRLRQA